MICPSLAETRPSAVLLWASMGQRSAIFWVALQQVGVKAAGSLEKRLSFQVRSWKTRRTSRLGGAFRPQPVASSSHFKTACCNAGSCRWDRQPGSAGPAQR